MKRLLVGWIVLNMMMIVDMTAVEKSFETLSTELAEIGAW